MVVCNVLLVTEPWPKKERSSKKFDRSAGQNIIELICGRMSDPSNG